MGDVVKRRFILKAKPVEVKPPARKLNRKEKALAEKGLRHVDFVVPIETWERFKVTCGDRKPNDVFNEWLDGAKKNA